MPAALVLPLETNLTFGRVGVLALSRDVGCAVFCWVVRIPFVID